MQPKGEPLPWLKIPGAGTYLCAMPLQLHEPLQTPGEWGLWQINESTEWLRAQLDLFPAELAELEKIRNDRRQREFLAARLLLHRMSGRAQRGELYKDDKGKPHLRDSAFHVSISHTVGYAAAIAHPAACGVDVQRIVPRIRRIAPKFVNDFEAQQLQPEHELIQLHLIWSAKEAMYKAFGRRSLDFRQHLFVSFAGYEAGQRKATASLRKGNICQQFMLEFRYFADLILVGGVGVPGNDVISWSVG